jgi:basic membrane protein A and related proteins
MSRKTMLKNLRLTLARGLVAVCLSHPSAFAQGSDSPKPTPPLKVGFVYVSPITPAGWTAQHEQGRLALQAALGPWVQTRFVENIPEGADAERVIRDLAAQGHQLIITPSFGYMEPTARVARDYPNVRFESITGYRTATNVSTANARYYEGRYLAGVAAGRSGTQLGYVAGFPIPEVLQGLNAFAMGARSVNPKATVRVVWLNEWFNPPKEREASLSLFNQGVEVLAFHTGSTAPMTAAQERGKWAIGYHSNMAGAGPDAQLMAVTHHWGPYYTQRAQAVLDGSWKSSQVWGGLASGMVDVGHFSPKLRADVRAEVLALKDRIAKGELKPFSAGAADVLDNNGILFIPARTSLSDGQILGMKQLVQGVVGGMK